MWLLVFVVVVLVGQRSPAENLHRSRIELVDHSVLAAGK